jgi:hypothetical protein
MTKNIKILGLCIVIAITGLSLENALTGHGIKGNLNLNPEVLATGSNSNSGTNNDTGSGSESETVDKYKIETIPFPSTVDNYKSGDSTCTKTTQRVETNCPKISNESCTEGYFDSTTTICVKFTPKQP